MRCSICKFQNKSKLELPCLECTSNRAMDYFKPMTNADRIRNFSDEELAEYFKGIQEHTIKSQKIDSVEDMLQWLQTEVKEDDSNAG